MPEPDTLTSRGRAIEEEYFRKKELELIEKMRQRAERQSLGAALGVADEEILSDLEALGYTRETVTLLHLVPLVQVAWIDGSVAESERRQIYELARIRGVEPGSVAYQQLTEWLTHRPPREFFEKTLRIVRDMLQAMPPGDRDASQRDLIAWCTQVAAASGGFLGLGNKVSEEERALLERVAEELEHNHEAAAKQVIAEFQP